MGLKKEKGIHRVGARCSRDIPTASMLGSDTWKVE
jgi:hypothetical protein